MSSFCCDACVNLAFPLCSAGLTGVQTSAVFLKGVLLPMVSRFSEIHESLMIRGPSVLQLSPSRRRNGQKESDHQPLLETAKHPCLRLQRLRSIKYRVSRAELPLVGHHSNRPRVDVGVGQGSIFFLFSPLSSPLLLCLISRSPSLSHTHAHAHTCRAALHKQLKVTFVCLFCGCREKHSHPVVLPREP